MTTTTDLTPPLHNLDLYRGDSVRLPYRLGTAVPDTSPVEFDEGYDLTGVTIAAQIRAKQDDALPMAEFDVVIEDQTDPDTAGMFTLILTATESELLLGTGARGHWFWDLEVTWGPDDVQTIESGLVTVDKDTTREA